MSLSRIRRTLVPAVMAVALLSGCSGNGTAPGTAVSIGDDSVSKSEVSRVADAVCRSIEDNLSEAGEQVRLSELKQYALSLLTVRMQAEQVADEQGIEPNAAYHQDVVRVQGEAETIPEDLRDDYVTALSTEAYLTSLMAQMGERALAAEGVTTPSEEEIMQRGSQLFATQVVERGAEVDPSYGAVMEEGALVLAETGASVPVSGPAIEALTEEPNPDYVGSLPESQRCGDGPR
ncbi:hypothetical protein [Nocardioides gilvus]|uniref:hypothetical protein n=1 Tax=Nocardioides gilvus TaxID=1735589 RepID=UPI000D7437D7|nr:hypothetical protein [Nocardioides gilvus]